MTTPVPSVDLRPDHWRIVRDALLHHVPDREVIAFGSRATWTAKDYSDLDLAVMGEEPLSLSTAAALDEELCNSDLPFKVDVVDWARLDDAFRRIIRRHGIPVQTLAKRSTPAKPLKPRSESQCRDNVWPKIPFSQVLTQPVRNGIYKPKKFHGHGVKVVNMRELFANSRLGNVPMRRVRLSDSEKSRYCLRASDLLFARRSLVAEGAGKCSIVIEVQEPTAFESSIICARPDATKCDSLFLYYYFNSPEGLHGLYSIRRQVAVAGITGSDLVRLTVPQPTLSEQREIAHILGTLDEKVELNRRMNKTLETMAQALFKSWFVDFDPVRAKMEGRDTGLPGHLADLFPDRLVESEMGEIPEKWEVAALDEIAWFQNGLALQKFRPTSNDGRLPVVKIAQLRAGTTNSGEWASDTIKPECIIEDGDIVFSWSGSLLVRMWCGGRAALNQHLFKVMSARFPRWFYLHSLLSHLRTFRRIARDKATTMGHIRRHHLTESQCVVPPDDVIDQLSGTFSCLLEQQVVNELSSRTLIAIRDSLLPKLLSGEIQVQVTQESHQAIS